MMGIARTRPGPALQRGASLIFALITLVSLMLAAIALVRSVDSGAKILGNIGFQQEATISADRAMREATNNLVSWKTSGVDLTVTDTSKGFYALATDNLDVTGQLGSPSTHTLVDWDNNSCGSVSPVACLTPMAATAMTSGSTASYVIFRLCQTTGALDTSNCAQPLTSAAGDPSNNGATNSIVGTSAGVYYRIVVRVTGARSTTSFTETIVQY